VNRACPHLSSGIKAPFSLPGFRTSNLTANITKWHMCFLLRVALYSIGTVRIITTFCMARWGGASAAANGIEQRLYVSIDSGDFRDSECVIE
jgi:hypothetical protein